jgi:hypothetical protein
MSENKDKNGKKSSKSKKSFKERCCLLWRPGQRMKAIAAKDIGLGWWQTGVDFWFCVLLSLILFTVLL